MSRLKKYSKVSTMDLWDVCTKIELALLNSVAEVRAVIGGWASWVWNDDDDRFFAAMVKRVLNMRLWKLTRTCYYQMNQRCVDLIVLEHLEPH